MSIYLIGIGGTGSKCIESLVYLASLGIFGPSPLRVMYVDPDETNGNLERSRNALNLYQKCYSIMGGVKADCAWMQTPIESFDIWSPFGDHTAKKELKDCFHYSTLKSSHPALGNLFDVLYTKEEREANLDVGFRGRPAIGSAVMSRVDLDRLDQAPWGQFIESIKADAGGGSRITKVLFCGSIFGGTGASGLPTLARLLANKLEKLNVRDRVQIGAVLTLPYFGFSPPAGQDPNEVYAKSEQFLLNSEAALRYYGIQAKGTFDVTYLLGNQTLSRVDFSVGKNSQRNEAHFVELFAALAARHFLQYPGEPSNAVIVASRAQPGRLNWMDLPECNVVKPEFVNAARFAYAWLADISLELAQARQVGMDKARRGAPWLERYFNPNPKREGQLPNLDQVDQQAAIAIFDDWCSAFLRWIYAVHQCESEAVHLFNTSILGSVNGELPEALSLKADNLPNLVYGDDRDRTRQAQDTMIQLKRNLMAIAPQPPNTGVTGLAKALYLVCRL
ncbi:hypothetical protein [Lyngbya confervoides]|uniref:Uncharacterized protein n=1 Tax=Lyngbya confervoides BDU141951 TaxID=1574623 RepID=A0ABD4T208_9CYAN|nr:hypothetical protein [Lyngbya confervoides]MCM1982612.1 hypothetical protein [Lyngbya confervoides BDU141951]